MKRDEMIAPVRLSVDVKSDQRRAFEVFTEQIGEWWPVATHSIEGNVVTEVELEGWVGGHIREHHAQGNARWGTIKVWEPPQRLVFSWNPSYEERPETEVEVTFIPVSDEETRVELEHRHWERLGRRGAAFRHSYSEGWIPVLDAYSMRVSK